MNEKLIDRNYLVRNVSITTVFSGLGIVTGLALDALVLFHFGLSRSMDAFFAAYALPFILSTTLTIQLPKVQVPIYAAEQKAGNVDKLNRLFSNFINSSLALLIVVTIVGLSLARLVMPIQVAGFNAETVELSVKLNRLLLWIVPIQGITATLRSVLFSNHRYLMASSNKIITNIWAILILLIMHRYIGIVSLGLGFLIGSFFSFLFTLQAAASLGFRYRLVLDLKDADLRHMYKQLLYPLGGHIVGEGRVLVENFLVSFLSGGSLSALRYATKIVEGPQGVLMSSVATATLPLVSHHTAERNQGETKLAILRSIKLSVLLAMPVCAWLVFTAKPMLSLLFERGHFERADVALTSMLIVLLTPYIMIGRVSSIFQTMFYADQDTRTPIVSAVTSLVTSAAFALAFIGLLGVYSLPIATSVSSILSTTAMGVLLRRKYGPLGWSELKSFGLSMIGATTVTAVAFFLGTQATKGLSGTTIIDKLIAFAVPSVTGTIGFLSASFLFGLISKRPIVDLLARRRPVTRE